MATKPNKTRRSTRSPLHLVDRPGEARTIMVNVKAVKDKNAGPRTIMVDTQPAPKPAGAPRVDRTNMRLLGAYVNKPAHKQFALLALDLDVMHMDLLREALNDLFVKHGRPPIA